MVPGLYLYRIVIGSMGGWAGGWNGKIWYDGWEEVLIVNLADIFGKRAREQALRIIPCIDSTASHSGILFFILTFGICFPE